MITENLSTLKIHKLTQAQYDRELSAGNIDESALYLTPDEEITLEQIGAAPAGYGLGEANGRWCDDCNTAVRPGFYYLGESTANTPAGYDLWRWAVMLVQRRNLDVFQTVMFNGVSATRMIALDENTGVVKTAGVWAYITPPLNVGVEYLTTEKFNGKPVYARMVKFDECSSSGTDEYLCDNANVSLIRVDGYWYNDVTGISWPFASNYFINDVYTNSDGTDTFLIVESHPEHDTSSYKGVASVYYIKN